MPNFGYFIIIIIVVGQGPHTIRSAHLTLCNINKNTHTRHESKKKSDRNEMESNEKLY